MKKNISEDLPARKFPQASLSKSNEGGGGDDRKDKGSKTPEKRVSQSVYDIRYRARRENLPLRQAYSSYIQNSSLSEQEKSMVREKLFGKDGIVKENYIEDISLLASNSVAKALYNVFVEKESEEIGEEYIEELKSQLNSSPDRKYKVRVTDKSGVSYVRYATREKINSLRANPNIREVEMTEYGEPYEGEKNKGVQTAASKSGKDYDGDGKVESPAKEYRGSVHNAIQRKKGGNPDGQDTSSVKEQFLEELNNEYTIDVKSKKKPKNKIVVHHKDKEGMNESSYSRFLGLLNEREMKVSEVKTEKEESCESDNGSNVDPRSMPTKVNLIKTRLRAAGARNPIVMVASEQAGPALPGENRPGSPKAPGGRPHLPGEGKTPSPKKTKLQLASYEPEGDMIDKTSTSAKMSLEDYMLVKPDGSRVRMPGNPPGRPASQGPRMPVTGRLPKTEIGSRFD